MSTKRHENDPSWDDLTDGLRRLAGGDLDALTIKRQHAHLLLAFAANLLEAAAERQDYDCPCLDRQQNPPECSLSANGRDCLCSYASEAMLAEASRLRNTPTAAPPAPVLAGKVAEALEWYAENVAGCRKLGSIGDPFRQALDTDGGKRARAALAAREAKP